MKTSFFIRIATAATAVILTFTLAAPNSLAFAPSPDTETGDAHIITDLEDGETIQRGLRFEKDGLGTPLEKYYPQYRLDPLKTSIEGFGVYVKPAEALEYYKKHYPEDISYISKECDLRELTLSNALEYNDCTDVLYNRSDYPFTSQFKRVATHVAFLADIERNTEIEDAVHTFNKNPSRRNFDNIHASSTQHNSDVLSGSDEHPDLYARVEEAKSFPSPAKPGASTYSFRPTILPEVGTPTSALTYARMYAAHPNPQYTNYGDHDCANFLSQILEAGGKQRTVTWHPNSATWINAAKMEDMLKTKRFSSFSALTRKATVGQAIFVNRDGKRFGHAGFIVGVKKGNLEIAQHSDNYVGWTNGRATRWKQGKTWALGNW